MRILHINCNYIGTTLHQLMIEKLDALGIDNEVFVPTYDKNEAVIHPNDNVFVSECFKKWNRVLFDYKQSKILKAIEEHYDVASFDLIHAYTLFTDGNVARLLSEKYCIPYIVAVRNTDVNDFFAKRIFLRNKGIKNLVKAKKVFFLSEAYRKQVFGKYVPTKYAEQIITKTEIIPNGIDDYWLENIRQPKKQINRECVKLVYVGGIDKNKNITTTQKAMAFLCEEGIQAYLTVVGKIKDEREYKRIISDKYTMHISAQPKENLLEIYRENDIFVMPSIHESFGLVYAEAMSQGLPVVFTRGQGFDGQFDNGAVGYSVTATNPDEIKDAIIAIVNDYHRLSTGAIQGAGKFSWDVLTNEYYRIYVGCLNE